MMEKNYTRGTENAGDYAGAEEKKSRYVRPVIAYGLIAAEVIIIAGIALAVILPLL